MVLVRVRVRARARARIRVRVRGTKAPRLQLTEMDLPKARPRRVADQPEAHC
jgi:hypothetical protein|tara:strand:- start:401 stop:556 length:156 start_codon:yes stop_codon:yes gene_type:complete